MQMGATFRAPFMWGAGFVSLVVGAYTLGRMSLVPSDYRLLITLSVIMALLGLSMRSKPIPMIFLLAYLPLMGLIRRILIPLAGWSGSDPLVILAPVVILLLGSYSFYHVYVLRDAVFEDTRLFRLVRWLIFICILEVFNPKQGGLTVGFAGMLFYVVPLFWMMLSREIMQRKHILIICRVTFVLSIFIALYGMKQTLYGYYPFEKAWMDLSGYTALNVGGAIRAISTLSNAQEYAQYLASAIVIGWVWLLRVNPWSKLFFLPIICFLGYALFMISARGPVVTTATALSVVTILHARKPKTRIILGFIVALVLTGVFVSVSHMPTSNNALVQHQLVGLTDPQNSSLSGHSTRMFDGILRGITMPTGYGLGSTTMATRFGGVGVGTEVDISNIFVSDGIFGGVVFLAVILYALGVGMRHSLQGDTLSLMVLGILFANLGQWLNGSLYSTAALVWVMIGYLDRVSRESRLKDTIHCVPEVTSC